MTRSRRWPLAALLLSTLAAMPAEAREPSERRYAVVIGANRGDPGELMLRHAERDAARVGDVLTRIGDVPQENLIHLKGASAARVREVLTHISERIEQEGQRDPRPGVLIVYYSGHADSGALHLGGTHLNFDTLSDQVDSAPAQVRLLVVDACRSGGLTRVKGAVPAETFDMRVQDGLKSTGFAVITSSAADESSMESDRFGGGVFTHHMLAGLLGAADHSSDGTVTLTEAWRYAYTETLRSTSAERVVQHPTYAFDLRGIEDVVLTRLMPDADTGSLALGLSGDWLIFEAGRAGQLVAEVSAASGALLSLPPGGYLVRHRGEDVVSEGVIAVQAGETTPAGSSNLAPIPYGTTARKGWSPRQRSAWALTTGGTIDGPPLLGQGLGGGGGLGVRVDTPALTLQLRLRYRHHAGETGSLRWTQQMAGLEIVAAKLFDLGPVAPGLGVRLGGDAAFQTFETQGQAPPTRALVPRFGTLFRVEFAVAPRLSLGLEAAADVAFPIQRDTTGQTALVTRVIPQGALELTWYAF